MAVVERWPLWRDGRCREVAVVERWHGCREMTVSGGMAVVERWPLWRDGRCREVAVVERWPL